MRESFISANAFPSKLIINPQIVQVVKGHSIYPAHIQLNITNKCTLNCGFCSCKKRDKKQELTLSEVTQILKTYKELGCEAVTVTGGGEPLCCPHLETVFEFCSKNQMSIGLTTNGTLLHKFPFVDTATWIRISLSDEANLDLSKLPEFTADMAFSYVLLKDTNKDYLRQAVKYGIKHKFTHIRLVDDILGDNSNKIEEAKDILKGIDNGIVIYQGRKKYTTGHKQCLLSLLKPNIGPDGNIYPCCGVQYLDKDPNLTFDKKYSMGTVKNIDKIYKKQQYFDGSICDRCYYSEYNYALNLLWNAHHVKHQEFV